MQLLNSSTNYWQFCVCLRVERKMNTMASLLLLISLLLIPRSALGCYDSFVNFGDSLSDNGNFFPTQTGANRSDFHFLVPPYGETYFHYPTGRCSDGRLIIDFTAEFMGLPLITPYLDIKNDINAQSFQKGLNFAVVGATALDTDYLEELGYADEITNCSLRVQMEWFKDMMSSLCNSTSDCTQLLSRSLVSMGGIGVNDYNHALLVRRSLSFVKSLVPLVMDAIGVALTELIELGASTIMVPGNIPVGCLPAFLTVYENSTSDEYNTTTGCLNWLNEFAEYHNEQLLEEMNRVGTLYPNVTLIYADYYNAMMKLYLSPEQYGFNETTKLVACCGGGGTYNYNSSVDCSYLEASATVCDDPSKLINWDGSHSTEAAYRWITKFLFEENYTSPPLASLCVSAE